MSAGAGGDAPDRPRVICVDDDPAVLSALRRALAREPYEVVTTQSTDEVLRLLADGRPSAVVADLRMPGVSGEDLMREVRLRHPGTGRLLLTAYPEVASALLRDRGEVMAKPWNPEELRTRLWESLPAKKDSPAGGAPAADEPFSLIADVERALQGGKTLPADPGGPAS